MCRPRSCCQEVIGISFLATMVFSDSSPHISQSRIPSLIYNTCLVGQGEVSVGHIAPFHSTPALITLQATSVIWTSWFLAQSSCYRANMGFTALVRVLPSDPPHDSSRTSHCLSANTSRLNSGRIRDFHPKAKRAATRTKKDDMLHAVLSFIESFLKGLKMDLIKQCIFQLLKLLQRFHVFSRLH